MGMRSQLVNAVARRVQFDRLRVRELHVGDHSTIIDGNGILFTTLASDPLGAPVGKTRLSAVNGALRRCPSAGAWQDV